MLEFLPHHIQESLRHINSEKLYEIRLRADKPITINYEGEYRYLGTYGFCTYADHALCCTAEEIADCVYRAGKYSVYSVEDQIKNGFLTTENGERIGIAGEYVFEGGKTLTIRNYSSICISVPHEVKGCGQTIYQKYMSDKIKNILIMSSPGMGKTTILRDLGRILSEQTKKNILICDERGEISSQNCGKSCDILKFADKSTAFEIGIRTMRPEVIITDELSLTDIAPIKRAIAAGLQVLASAHYSRIEHLPTEFLKIFDRYIFLNNKIGEVVSVYDKEGQIIC